MKAHRLAIAISSLLMSLPGAAASAGGKEEFTFRFAPVESTRVTQQYRQIRERLIAGQAPQKDEATATTVGRFGREGEDYTFSIESMDGALRRNGQEITDPLLALLNRTKTVYVIGSAGEAKDVRGFAGIEAQMKQSLPPPVFAALAPHISEARLIEKAKAEWNARYADFAGGTFSVGEVIDVKAPYPMPGGGQIEYTIRTSFAGWETCPAGRCIRVVQAYESDASALGAIFNAVTDALTRGMVNGPAVPAVQGGTRITGGLQRLIDPATMLIYAEQVQRVVTMPMEIPGQGKVAVELRELRSYEYSYE